MRASVHHFTEPGLDQAARRNPWSALDLPAMIRAGHGERRLPLQVRCQVCGEVGRLQVRPPMPLRCATGWVSP